MCCVFRTYLYILRRIFRIVKPFCVFFKKRKEICV
nr:MAG TPA: hypothetical protein [Caudoviricetes sp.]